MDAQTLTIASSKSSSSDLLSSRSRNKREGREHSLLIASYSNQDALVTLCHPPPTKRLKLKRVVTMPTEQPPCHGHGLIIDALPNHIISDILFEYLDQTPKQLSILRSKYMTHNLHHASLLQISCDPMLTIVSLIIKCRCMHCFLFHDKWFFQSA